mmetsp:Transcript_16132/g.48633  ORF Transcript_16132/g.48633 Transcript_16132/m.48633 type:complete len:338 (+) Transcript_16132:46-1059(+)
MVPLPRWLTCCAARDDRITPGLVPVSIDDVVSNCNEDAYFDCAETMAELHALDSEGLTDSNKIYGSEQKGRSKCTDLCGGCTDLAVARAVMERAHELFSQRVSELTKCGPELEWADLSAANRMLQANNVDVQKAVEMFVQALEMRARYRDLLQTMRCQTCCDIRVFGRDVEERPVIYMCARSLNVPIGRIREQFMVTFEAACRATSKQGRVLFIVDMFGMRPHLYADFHAVKDLADTLGTVFCERIYRIVVVDFSRAAQAAWWMLKPMLTQKTRDKFAFLSNSRAREHCREMFSPGSYEQLCKTFDVNRDKKASEEERELHARRTTMFDVPLGPPLK